MADKLPLPRVCPFSGAFQDNNNNIIKFYESSTKKKLKRKYRGERLHVRVPSLLVINCTDDIKQQWFIGLASSGVYIYIISG